MFAAAVAAAMTPGRDRRDPWWTRASGRPRGTAAAIEAVCAAAEGRGHWSEAGTRSPGRRGPFDTLGEDFVRPGLGAHRPSRLHAIEGLPVALGMLLVAGGDYRDTVSAG